MTTTDFTNTERLTAAVNQTNVRRSRDGFSSLGIAVDNLDIDGAVDRIGELIKEFQEDGKARSVVTLNVDFMVNALGYFFSRPRHPELLETLRSADLVPGLAAKGAEQGWSLYLLGGQSGSADEAAEKLLSDHPGGNGFIEIEMHSRYRFRSVLVAPLSF
jgi:UDP-N-acetyl-D-mannosaminuronic acid transferase (WecB/TagA/CpsF family)